jgi:NodT family efflux transporter outer membrane factor (OMF) lipoprotein
MKTRALTTVCLALFLCGCAPVGPDYTAPNLNAPPQWSEGAKEAQEAEAAPGLEAVAWWQALNDPELDQLMNAAMAGNLDVDQARARIRQARAEFKAAAAGSKPNGNGTGSVTRSKDSKNVSDASGETTTLYTPGFDATWEVDVFGSVRRSGEAAEARVGAQIEDLHATQLTLLGDVANAYVQLRAAQEQLAITERTLKSQSETADVTRVRYQNGLTSYLDVAQAEAETTTTAADVPAYETTIKQSIHRLSILIGQPPAFLKKQLGVTRSLPDCGGVAATGLPSELLVRRPDLREADRTLAAASADIGVATAELYPKFDLTLGLGLNSDTISRLSSLSSGYWSLVPQVSALLFDGGKTKAGVEKNVAVYEEALAAYHSTFLKALEDVENALVSYASAQTKRQTLTKSVQAYKETLMLAEEQYRKGLTSFLDVLDAQRSLYTAQNSLSATNAEVLTSFISLNKALGGGWKVFVDADRQKAVLPDYRTHRQKVAYRQNEISPVLH